MRTLSLVILLLFSLNVFSQDHLSFQEAASVVDSELSTDLKTEERNLYGKWRELLDSQNIQPSETCVDELQTRKMQVIFGAAAAPLVGAASGYAQIYIMAGIFALAYPSDGWAALGGAIMGMLTGAATYVGYQTVRIVKAINVARMQRIVVEARIGEGNALRTFSVNTLKKAGLLPSNQNLEKIKAMIVDLDQTGKLCNSELKSEYRQRRFARNGKVRNGVATKRELKKYLVNNI